MNNSYTTFIQIAFYSTMIAMITQRAHLLMLLLCLEGMMLSLVLYVPFLLSVSSMHVSMISIVMLTFGACEASLGLSLMVSMSRSYGSDMLKSITSNKC